MGRICQICDAGADAFARQKAKEGKNPKTIIKAINDRYGISIEYHQYRYHVKHHDLAAGTAIVAKRGADKQLVEAGDMYAKSAKLLEDMQGFMSKVVGFQSLIESEEFEMLPIDKKIKAINETVKTMLKAKEVEMKQQTLDLDRNPALEDYHRLISNAKGKKPIVVKEGNGNG